MIGACAVVAAALENGCPCHKSSYLGGLIVGEVYIKLTGKRAIFRGHLEIFRTVTGNLIVQGRGIVSPYTLIGIEL